jgi:predicted lipase
MLLKLLLLHLFSLGYSSYNLQQANISVFLSGAAYCNKENYATMKLSGPATGFVTEAILYDVKTDIQGYIGYLSSSKTIYTVIRGTSSALNWLDDLEVIKIPYTTFSECNCDVHTGFYNSALSIRTKTVDVVKLLKTRFPLYSVIMTGHSLGGAITQLLGMELEKEGIKVQIYNFGQPRIGDENYGDFVNTIVLDRLWRFTHYKDMVPHIPPEKGMNYLHSCREVYENENGDLKLCSTIDCEDPTCANQYALYQTNWNDHHVYLGHPMDCLESAIS